MATTADIVADQRSADAADIQDILTEFSSIEKRNGLSPSPTLQLSEESAVSKTEETSSQSSPSSDQTYCRQKAEKSLLLVLFKDSINKCVNIATKQQCLVKDGDLEPTVLRVLHIFEMLLCHGLQRKVVSANTVLEKLSKPFSIFSKPTTIVNCSRKLDEHPTVEVLKRCSFWPVVEQMVKNQKVYRGAGSTEHAQEVYDTVNQVKELSSSPVYRSKMLIRFLVMKKLSHDFLALVKENCCDCYKNSNTSLLLCEDTFTTVHGLLISLSAVDIDFYLRSESTAEAQAHYHRCSALTWNLSPTYLAINLDTAADNHLHRQSTDEYNVQSVISQKSYLEQENLSLHAKLVTRNEKLEVLEGDLGKSATMNEAYRSSLDKLKSDLESQVKKQDLEKEHIESLKSLLAGETASKCLAESKLAELTSQNSELEMAIKILERDVSDKRSQITELTSKNGDLNVLKDELYEKYHTEKSQGTRLNESSDELRKALTSMRKMMQELENSNEILEKQVRAKRDEAESLRGQVDAVTRMRDTVTSDLQVERDWRQKLTKENVAQKEQIKGMKGTSEKVTDMENRLSIAKEEKEEAFLRIHELEQSLGELAEKFEDQVVTADQVKDYVAHSVGLKGAWVADDSVDHCNGCNIKFTMSRRKHHCRRCGHIFCAKCSNGSAKLSPTSSKAVRVCDDCRVYLTENTT